MQIFADIIDIITKHEIYDIPPATRMPQFETAILQAACGSPEQYQRVIEFLTAKKEETNTDEELARRIEEELIQHIASAEPLIGKTVMNPLTERIFIRSQVLEHWFKDASYMDKKHPSEVIRNMAKTGMLSQVDPNLLRWPHHDRGTLKRRSGILWNYSAANEDTRVIALLKNKAVEIIEG